jgi:8-oxo-dGTP diphosphatase
VAARTVRAAGGVVYRLKKGDPEFLLVRRPRYKDWTLPKGKLDPGEGPQEAALREVREETGLHCVTQAEVGSIGYELGSGRRKAVRYWLMAAEDGEFAPNSEVDKIKWLPAPQATARLSYRKDRAVLARGAEMVIDPDRGVVHVVRHAAAGTRTKSKTDSGRHLSNKGARQSIKLSRRLSREPIAELRSSRLPRCMETMRPLGRALGLDIAKDERLVEGGDLDAMLSMVADLAGTAAVVCTHGDMIDLLIDHLDADGVDLGGVKEWRKGSVWTLDTRKGKAIAGRYRKPPS